jgi:hypothetical protein
MSIRIEIHGPRGQLDRFTVSDTSSGFGAYEGDVGTAALGRDLRAICRNFLDLDVTEIDSPCVAEPRSGFAEQGRPNPRSSVPKEQS